mmetsp:Transcript_11587/g.38213  ORF Transcript_11587/g.38213 Transcript_11587/m.38213 type:complete len:220 (-) Transcript_11587:2654-3313(-)
MSGTREAVQVARSRRSHSPNSEDAPVPLGGCAEVPPPPPCPTAARSTPWSGLRTTAAISSARVVMRRRVEELMSRAVMTSHAYRSSPRARPSWATPSVQPCALPPKTSSIGRPVLSRARSTAVFSASLPLTWKRACALREIAHSTEALCEASSEATEAPPASPTPMAGSGATPPATEWTPQRGNIPSDPLPDSTSETISHALPEPAATGSASLVCALPR